MPEKGPCARASAMEKLKLLTEYLNSEDGGAPWQLQYIRRASHYP